jgi:hypothetical protein
MCAQARLKPVLLHVGHGDITGDWAAKLADAKTIGVRWVVLSSFPGDMYTVDGIRLGARQLDEAGQAVRHRAHRRRQVLAGRARRPAGPARHREKQLRNACHAQVPAAAGRGHALSAQDDPHRGAVPEKGVLFPAHESSPNMPRGIWPGRRVVEHCPYRDGHGERDMNDYAKTLERQAVWTPASGARKPEVYLPHPPLPSGGWYRGADTEVPGPGRAQLDERPARMSTRSVVVLTLMFGLFGLLARTFDDGAFAVAGTMAAIAAPALLLRGRRRAI